jgi:hypothetical protein
LGEKFKEAVNLLGKSLGKEGAGRPPKVFDLQFSG